ACWRRSRSPYFSRCLPRTPPAERTGALTLSWVRRAPTTVSAVSSSPDHTWNSHALAAGSSRAAKLADQLSSEGVVVDLDAVAGRRGHDRPAQTAGDLQCRHARLVVGEPPDAADRLYEADEVQVGYRRT